jgi:hypothetical protein
MLLIMPLFGFVGIAVHPHIYPLALVLVPCAPLLSPDPKSTLCIVKFYYARIQSLFSHPPLFFWLFDVLIWYPIL